MEERENETKEISENLQLRICLLCRGLLDL